MLSKSRLTFLRLLRQKKNRREQGLFVAEGSKLAGELAASHFEIETLYATRNWMERNGNVAAEANETVVVSDEELERISSLVTPQEVLAVVRTPEVKFSIADVAGKHSLFLDGIRDPGNLGTIIRIADWFGMEDIFCTPDTAEVWNPKVVQASMGSITRVRVHETDAEHFFTTLKKNNSHLPVSGTFMEGENIFTSDLSYPGVVVIGNESSGIRSVTEKFIDRRITIPSFGATGRQHAESLNAAVATAIICAEIRRRQV